MSEAQPAAAAVEVRNVAREFGGIRAVDDVAFSVYRGEFFSLLGPSGCGKTTLMRMIAGFESPDRGAILIDGEDMAGVPPDRRPVNMMFQSYALFPHLTVEGNVSFGLRLRGGPRSAIEARTQDMLRLVRLEGLGLRKPHQLSGGQRQRVALARALALAPKVLLLDEPLGALDKKLRGEMQSELKRIQAATGTTFIVVTHDQEEAMALSDRMAIMREGRIVQIGRPDAIYDEPASAWVAGFVGDVNLLPVTIESRPDGTRIAVIRGIEEALPHEVPAGSGLRAALRPERLIVSSLRSDAAERWIAAHVESRSHLGPFISYRLRARDGLALAAQIPTGGGGSVHAPGDEVWAGFRTADIRLLGD